MKKALIISNKIRKIPGGSIETIVNPLKTRGYEVTWAANFSTAKFDVKEFPCNILKTKSETNPFSINNVKTRRIIKNYLIENNVDLIFCSTPIGGVHGRMCSKYVNKVIYQAHGFLFFKGGPKLGFFYKMVEKYLARKTDAIITINKEDFENAKSFKLRNKENIFLVNGSGEDYVSTPISEEKRSSLFKEFDLNSNDFTFISIGELNKNKNVLSTVKGFSKAFSEKDNVKLLICGEGKESKKISAFIKKNKLGSKVLLLGYRNDVRDLLQISNCYVSSSLREGLSRTVGESMACCLPCIVSNKRGLSDWIDENGGLLFNPKSANEICDAMIAIMKKDIKAIGEYNKKKVHEFSSEKVVLQMKEIFDKVL